jgi:hypothetical protein
MARKPKRKIRVFWKVGNGEEQCVDVLAPVITGNAVIDRQLKKAGLEEIVSLVTQDGAGWIEYDVAVGTYDAARTFFAEHPESLPFSDMVEEAISDVLEALGEIDNEAQLRFCTVE